MAPVTCHVWFEEGRTVPTRSADTFWESHVPRTVVDAGDNLEPKKVLFVIELTCSPGRQTIKKEMHLYIYV